MKRLLVSGLLVLCLAGCSSDGKDAATPTPTPAVATSSAPSPTPSPTPRALSKAKDMVLALKAAGLPISITADYTAETDPNHKLGRPHGYESDTHFRDTRIKFEAGMERDGIERGGGIEVFSDEQDARDRDDYIESVERDNPIIGTEYRYLNGPALLRLSDRLTPAQARAYKDAFMALTITAPLASS